MERPTDTGEEIAEALLHEPTEADLIASLTDQEPLDEVDEQFLAIDPEDLT